MSHSEVKQQNMIWNYSRIKAALVDFKENKGLYDRYIEGFYALKKEFASNGVSKNFPDKIHPFNPISPLQTAEVMMFLRLEYISKCFYKNQPSHQIIQKILDLKRLTQSKESIERDLTFVRIYESLDKNVDRSILEELSTDLNDASITESLNLMDEIIHFGETVQLEFLKLNNLPQHIADCFIDSIKSVRCYRRLLDIIKHNKGDTDRVWPVEEELFPIVHSLTALCERDPREIVDKKFSKAAESNARSVQTKNLTFIWNSIDYFLKLFDIENLSRPDQHIKMYGKARGRERFFDCIFVPKMPPKLAFISSCFFRVKYSNTESAQTGDSIKFVCLSLDREGRNLKEQDIAMMVEQAFIGAYQIYQEKCETEVYKFRLKKIPSAVETVYYSIGDVLEDYEGESIGATTFCNALSFFSQNPSLKGVYYTGKVDNSGDDDLFVEDVPLKADIVKQQKPPDGKETSIFIVPEKNYSDDLKQFRSDQSNKVRLECYRDNETLFEIWAKLALSPLVKNSTLPSEQQIKESEQYLSRKTFSKRRNDNSNSDRGIIANSLLYLISPLAFGKEIALTKLQHNLDSIDRVQFSGGRRPFTADEIVDALSVPKELLVPCPISFDTYFGNSLYLCNPFQVR